MSEEEDRLRLLLDAVVTLAADLTLDGVLSRIAAIASSLVDAEYAALGVLDAGPGRRLRTFVHHGLSDERAARIGRLPIGHGVLGLLMDDPRPLRLHDIAAHPTSYGFPVGHPPMKSFLGVPIRIRDQVFGNLYLTEKVGGGDFTDEDESVAVALAVAAGVVIENAHLYEEAAQREHWLNATADVTALLAASGVEVDAFQAIADRAHEASGADIAWVVSGKDADSLELHAVSGAKSDLEPVTALLAKESLTSQVVRSRAAVSDESTAVPGLGPAIVVPIDHHSGFKSALGLAWNHEHIEQFHRVDPALPVRFAEHVALAIDGARAREDQERLRLFEDRDRIGQDLHDHVIQRLFAVGLGLQAAGRGMTDPVLATRLDVAVNDLDHTIKEIRRTIFALGRPEASTDIQTEITRMVERGAATMKFSPSLRFTGAVRTLIDAELAPDLLAVLKEALSNASRHAQASAIDVHVSAHDEVTVRVTDDGRGFEDDVLESGLRNMRERAVRHGGSLSVISSPGHGTTVTWTVPVTPR